MTVPQRDSGLPPTTVGGAGLDRRGSALSHTGLGLLIGTMVGAVTALGGWSAFVTVVLLGALGLVIGMIIDGRIDVASLIGRASERR